jgi:hypothetical protein
MYEKRYKSYLKSFRKIQKGMDNAFLSILLDDAKQAILNAEQKYNRITKNHL